MKFEVEFLPDAEDFVGSLDSLTRRKVFYNIRKSQEVNDPKLFKKINKNIWEFRTKYNRKNIRLLAFWTTKENKRVLVVCTHGFVKKSNKTPLSELKRAEQLRKQFLNQ